jgi:hypothetical protein
VWWLIEYANELGEKFQSFHTHNAIGDYRQVDPNATSMALVPHAHIARLEKELAEAKTESAKQFALGARTMFNQFQHYTSMNYHGDPEIDKLCNEENWLIDRISLQALADVSPADAEEWASITQLQKDIEGLKKGGA